MKLRTRMAIIALAAFLTLVGVNFIANAFAPSVLVTAHNPATSVTFQVTSVRVLG